MRSILTSVAVFVLVFVPVTAAHAQTPIPPDIKTKMSGYVGTWEVEEWVKESPSGPEVVQTGMWEARWAFDAFIEWRGNMTSDGKTTTNVEFEGYDPLMQGFTFWFGSDGSRGEAYDGEWDGNTLTIQLIEHTADGQSHRGRCIWPYSADFAQIQDYHCEKLTDGEWWVFRRGSSTKAAG